MAKRLIARRFENPQSSRQHRSPSPGYSEVSSESSVSQTYGPPRDVYRPRLYRPNRISRPIKPSGPSRLERLKRLAEPVTFFPERLDPMDDPSEFRLSAPKPKPGRWRKRISKFFSKPSLMTPDFYKSVQHKFVRRKAKSKDQPDSFAPATRWIRPKSELINTYHDETTTEELDHSSDSTTTQYSESSDSEPEREKSRREEDSNQAKDEVTRVYNPYFDDPQDVSSRDKERAMSATKGWFGRCTDPCYGTRCKYILASCYRPCSGLLGEQTEDAKTKGAPKVTEETGKSTEDTERTEPREPEWPDLEELNRPISQRELRKMAKLDENVTSQVAAEATDETWN